MQFLPPKSERWKQKGTKNLISSKKVFSYQSEPTLKYFTWFNNSLFTLNILYCGLQSLDLSDAFWDKAVRSFYVHWILYMHHKLQHLLNFCSYFLCLKSVNFYIWQWGIDCFIRIFKTETDFKDNSSITEISICSKWFPFPQGNFNDTYLNTDSNVFRENNRTNIPSLLLM